MASRQDAKFKSYDGLTLRGWFYRAGENRPCIILTHGLAGLKEQYLPDFAERFQAAGYGALIYDNRNYGSSDGQPRNHTDPFLQHRDYSAAFDFVASLPDVDPTNIIFWGSSLSGGNATQAAAIDIRVRSVILQCPFVSSERVREELGNSLKNAFSDRASSIAGKEPTMIPVNPYSGKGSKGDKERAVLTDPDIHSYHAELDRRGIPHGLSITLQSLIAISGFEPGALIDRISPKPLLMIIGEMEKTIPIDLQLRTFEKAREPKQLHIVKGQGHFGLYHGEGFQENVQVQLDWLKRILLTAIHASPIDLEDHLLNASIKKTLNRKEPKYVSRRILEALKVLHEECYVHADAKLDNVLVNYGEGDNRFSDVQLSDLGGTYLADSKYAQAGTLVGAPMWSSPEVIMETPWNTVTDIWCFGAMLISLTYGGKFNLFRPNTVPYGYEDYGLEVLKRHFRYFSRFLAKYEEISSLDTIAAILYLMKEIP